AHDRGLWLGGSKQPGSARRPGTQPRSHLVAGLSFLGLESTDRGARPRDPEPSLPGTGSRGAPPRPTTRPALRSQPDKNQRALPFVQKSCPTPAPTVTNGAILALASLPSVPASRARHLQPSTFGPYSPPVPK